MAVATNLPQSLDWDDNDLFEEVAEQTPFWDEGQYLFITRSIKRAQGGDPKFGVSNEWLFEVRTPDGQNYVKVDENGEPVLFRQFISTKMTPLSRGRPLIEAIVGRKLADGENVSGSEIRDKPFLGFILYEVPRGSTDGQKKPYLRNPSTFKRQQANQARPAPVPAPIPQQTEELEELPF